MTLSAARAFALPILAVVSASVCGAPTQAAAECQADGSQWGQVVANTGAVFALGREGQRRRLSCNDAIAACEVLVTGPDGRLALVVRDVYVKLAPSSRLRLSSEAPGFDLEVGGVRIVDTRAEAGGGPATRISAPFLDATLSSRADAELWHEEGAAASRLCSWEGLVRWGSRAERGTLQPGSCLASTASGPPRQIAREPAVLSLELAGPCAFQSRIDESRFTPNDAAAGPAVARASSPRLERDTVAGGSMGGRSGNRSVAWGGGAGESGAELPAFAWPPPRWDKEFSVPSSIFDTSKYATFGPLAEALQAEISQAFDGKTIKGFYEIPKAGCDGFIYFAPVERIDASTAARLGWRSDYALGRWLAGALSFGRDKFRVLGFFVGPKGCLDRDSGVAPTLSEARAFTEQGARSLAGSSIAKRALPENLEMVVLVYEFELPPYVAVPDTLAARCHLAGAKLWSDPWPAGCSRPEETP